MPHANQTIAQVVKVFHGTLIKSIGTGNYLEPVTSHHFWAGVIVDSFPEADLTFEAGLELAYQLDAHIVAEYGPQPDAD